VLADELDADWSQVKIVNPPVWDEKTYGSAMLAAAGVRLVVGPAAGTTACPKAVVAAAAAKITDRRRFRCFALMPTPVHDSHVLIAWDQSEAGMAHTAEPSHFHRPRFVIHWRQSKI